MTIKDDRGMQLCMNFCYELSQIILFVPARYTSSSHNFVIQLIIFCLFLKNCLKYAV